MKRISKKLIVYLDQNFISEIAKLEKNGHIDRSRFARIEKALHQGFLDEKTVVPWSWFHDLETSAIQSLKEAISTKLGYVGQTEARHPEHVRSAQFDWAVKNFFASVPADPSYLHAFDDNPDMRVRMLNVKVDSHLEHFDYRSWHIKDALALDATRKKNAEDGVTYGQHMAKEIEARRQAIPVNDHDRLRYLFKDEASAKQFLESKSFEEIPQIDIFASLWAKILTQYPDRPIKPSDINDIDIVAAYLPYVDVFATDSFVADLLKSIKADERYNAKVFGGSRAEQERLAEHIENSLQDMEPINRPAGSIFVLPTDSVKKGSFELFYQLGMQSGNVSHEEVWIDIWGLDDDDMPRYMLKKGAGFELPFYGLQDVHTVKIVGDSSYDQIVATCKEMSRSDRFVIIDKFDDDLPDDFGEKAIEACSTKGISEVYGFSVTDR